MTAAQINATTMALKKALIERALAGELSHHLGYAPGEDKPAEVGNIRNGATAKTVRTEDGPLRIEVPRDRAGSFEPVLIPKHERRFTGFDDKIVALYARGMTMREIQGFLAVTFRHKGAGSFRHIGARIWRGDGHLSRGKDARGEPRSHAVLWSSALGASACDTRCRRARGSRRCGAGGRGWRTRAGDWPGTPDPTR